MKSILRILFLLALFTIPAFSQTTQTFTGTAIQDSSGVYWWWNFTFTTTLTTLNGQADVTVVYSGTLTNSTTSTKPSIGTTFTNDYSQGFASQEPQNVISPFSEWAFVITGNQVVLKQNGVIIESGTTNNY